MFSKAKSDIKTPISKTKKKLVSPSIISTDMVITGNAFSDGDIQIDGKIDGDICSRNLTVGKMATVNGTVMGDVIHVSGIINGEITARVVFLTETARVTGNINHDSLSIEAGAYLQGLCKRTKIDLQKILIKP